MGEGNLWKLAPLVVLLSASWGTAYYLPGTYPQEFYKGATVRGALGSDRPSEEKDEFTKSLLTALVWK